MITSSATTTARKLAVIIWNMIIKSQDYIQYDTQTLTEKRKNAQISNIKKRLFRLNLTAAEMAAIFQKASLSIT